MSTDLVVVTSGTDRALVTQSAARELVVLSVGDDRVGAQAERRSNRRRLGAGAEAPQDATIQRSPANDGARLPAAVVSRPLSAFAGAGANSAAFVAQVLAQNDSMPRLTIDRHRAATEVYAQQSANRSARRRARDLSI